MGVSSAFWDCRSYGTCYAERSSSSNASYFSRTYWTRLCAFQLGQHVFRASVESESALLMGCSLPAALSVAYTCQGTGEAFVLASKMTGESYRATRARCLRRAGSGPFHRRETGSREIVPHDRNSSLSLQNQSGNARGNVCNTIVSR